MMLAPMVESDFAAAGLPRAPLRRGRAGSGWAGRSQQSGLDPPIEYGTPAGSVPRQGGARRLHRGSRPNVVLMNVDDTGWGDYGFNNPAKSRDTPHLDALRSEGMRFTDLHAGASVCTPSRAALLTGRVGLRTGVVGNFMPYSLGGLPSSETTIATLLRQAGYATGMAGKWHLGHRARFLPRAHGFDRFLGLAMSHDYGCTDHPGPDTNCKRWAQQTCGGGGGGGGGALRGESSADGPECPISRRNPWGSSVPLYVDDAIVEQPVDHRTLHGRYAAFAASFVASAAAAGRPFFLYMAYSHLHTPLVYDIARYGGTAINSSSSSSLEAGRGHYSRAVRELDNSVGHTVGALRRLGLSNTTLLLFTGDNGGGDFQCSYGGDNAPYLGLWQRRHDGGSTGKTSTWEGGHREPGLAVWPGHIAPGSTSNTLVSQLDFLPTIALLAGVPLPTGRDYDGLDLAPELFAGPGRRILSRRLLLHPNSGEGPPGGLDTARIGRYKAKWRSGGIHHGCKAKGGPEARKAPLRYHSPPLLFDLEADPAEAFPLDPKTSPLHAAALRLLERGRAAAQRSVAADPLRSAVDWAEREAVRPCCDPGAAMCRCGPSTKAEAFPATALPPWG